MIDYALKAATQIIQERLHPFSFTFNCSTSSQDATFGCSLHVLLAPESDAVVIYRGDAPTFEAAFVQLIDAVINDKRTKVVDLD